jgi:peroxidase
LQGLGASVLLDDTENFVGEKSWTIELELVKSDLESVCPETVSCANILAVVATDSVLLVCCIFATLHVKRISLNGLN